MMNNETGITTRKPDTPGDADFAIYINFKKGEGNPYRVFKVAEEVIKSFQKLDRALCVSVDSTIEPLMMLEEIETGSIKIWLKNALTSTDDQALKDIDWKPAVGKYLVRAKYAYINWANKSEGNVTLVELGNEIKKIAAETDVKHLPDYAPPPTQKLAVITQELDVAKRELIDGDSLQYISPDEPPLDFDLKVYWSPEELDDMSIKETTKFDNMRMNLIVKKPDYLGASKWDFRHGSKQISASIHDDQWLIDFQHRNVDIRPGDAIRCLVSVENSYGYDNELVKETYTVTKVEEVLIEQAWKQDGLLSDDTKNLDHKD